MKMIFKSIILLFIVISSSTEIDANSENNQFKTNYNQLGTHQTNFKGLKGIQALISNQWHTHNKINSKKYERAIKKFDQNEAILLDPFNTGSLLNINDDDDLKDEDKEFKLIRRAPTTPKKSASTKTKKSATNPAKSATTPSKSSKAANKATSSSANSPSTTFGSSSSLSTTPYSTTIAENTRAISTVASTTSATSPVSSLGTVQPGSFILQMSSLATSQPPPLPSTTSMGMINQVTTECPTQNPSSTESCEVPEDDCSDEMPPNPTDDCEDPNGDGTGLSGSRPGQCNFDHNVANQIKTMSSQLTSYTRMIKASEQKKSPTGIRLALSYISARLPTVLQEISLIMSKMVKSSKKLS